MPSGATHDRITLWTLPWITGITYGLTRNGEFTLILSVGFLFSGLMFGPDLDIYSVQYKRWGLLKGIWMPYRLFFRHRSIFSHGPIIGTCVRVLYLSTFIALFAMLAVAIAQLFFGFDWNWQEFALEKSRLLADKYPREAMALFIGLELGAMSHSISDLIDSHRQRRWKRKQLKATRTNSRSTTKTTKIRR
jgi:uncharacterized metal-binding protein